MLTQNHAEDPRRPTAICFLAADVYGLQARLRPEDAGPGAVTILPHRTATSSTRSVGRARLMKLRRPFSRTSRKIPSSQDRRFMVTTLTLERGQP